MQSVICTLFEGNYHQGVAALTNSLFRKGFRGAIYAGYRGVLPAWCSGAKENKSLNWPGGATLEVIEGIQLHFLPLVTDYHLTNYKPDFMLSLLSGPASGADAIYYLDPDIVVTAPWYNFEQWTACGIAVCEDINSPLSKYHPRRVGWRNFYAVHHIVLTFKEGIYVNGGFIGLSKKDAGFLNLWRSLQELMAPEVGGLNNTILSGKKQIDAMKGRFATFGKTDQDVINAAIEAWDGPVSFVGKEGMGFIAGTSIVPHAVGGGKPWEVTFFERLTTGRSPRAVDKAYWGAVNYPISVYPKRRIMRKQLAIKVTAFIGRFYSRNY